MPFVELGQCQVAASDLRQDLPTLQGLALTWQRQHIQMIGLQRAHQLRQLILDQQRLLALGECL